MELATLALVYVYTFLGFAFAAVAERTGTGGAWMAFVPPFQPFLLARLAGRPFPWALALALPGLNLVVLAALLGDVAARRGLPHAVGWLTVAAPTGLALGLTLSEQPSVGLTAGASVGALCAYAGLVAFAR